MINFSENKPSYNLPPSSVRTSVFYINDFHGCESKMANLKTAVDSFSKKYKKPGIDTFRLSGGDIIKGKNSKINKMWVEFLNMINIDFAALGNHEFDAGTQVLNELAKKADFKYVSTNIDIPKYSVLKESRDKNKIVSSWIENKNGHEYGFVGLTPVEDKYKTKDGTLNNKDIKVKDLKTSLKELQKEVNKLQELGVNKIFLLSHFSDDKNIIPKTISGIDVMISGHKHKKYSGIEAGKNFFTTPSGEPLIKVEGGRDGITYGILDLVFDEAGRITNAKNTLKTTEKYPEDFSVIGLNAKYKNFGKPIGILAEDLKLDYFHESPLASFAADAIREKSGAEVALVLGNGFTEGIEKGILSKRHINKVLPFRNKLVKVKLSEKELIDALNNGAKPCKDKSESNLLQVSGLKYKVGKDKRVKDVYLEKSDGKLERLNSENPDSKKFFSVAYDEYLLKGKQGFDMLKKSEAEVEKYNWTKSDAMIERIENKHFIPFSLKPDSRIKFE